MRGALTAAAFAALSAAVAPAPGHANVIYALAPTAVTPIASSFVPSTGRREIGFGLEPTDDAPADGRFVLSGAYNNPLSRILPRYDGDLREFVRFGVTTETYVATPTQRAGSLDISLTFSAAGDVIAGRIVTRGLDAALDLGIADGVVSGFVSGFFSEAGAPSCGELPDARGCSVSGLLVRTGGSSGGPADVPEPSSLALLGVGAFGLAAASRREPSGTGDRWADISAVRRR